ncbi:hypothetical protein VPH35_109771 [Triticum aestivum]
MMSRRFLYMVLNNYMHAPSAWYTLHRIDPSRLFYPRGTPTPASPPPPPENERLPDPAMSFYPPHSAHDAGSREFALLGGRGKDRIVAMDHTGRAVLYDDYSHAVHPLPPVTAPKWCPTLSLAADGQDGAYIIEADPQADDPGRGSVEALAYDHKPAEDDEDEGWVWRPLEPPPYVRVPGYGDEEGGRSGKITCHAAEGARIWVSTAGRGTYCLDTASGAWTKAGDWALPFQGRAVPIPEYASRLWFGVSASDAGYVCASDLQTAANEGRAPVADQVWDGFAVPEGFHDLESHSYVVHLGDRRLCVAKFFETTRQEACDDDWMCSRCCHGYVSECAFAMITGVEVEPGAGRWHRLIKHRSLRYSLGTDRVPVCVL